MTSLGFRPKKNNNLVSRLDISNPPSRNELTQWKLDIEKSIQNKSDIKSIFDIAVALSEKDIDISKLAI